MAYCLSPLGEIEETTQEIQMLAPSCKQQKDFQDCPTWTF